MLITWRCWCRQLGLTGTWLNEVRSVGLPAPGFDGSLLVVIFLKFSQSSPSICFMWTSVGKVMHEGAWLFKYQGDISKSWTILQETKERNASYRPPGTWMARQPLLRSSLPPSDVVMLREEAGRLAQQCKGTSNTGAGWGRAVMGADTKIASLRTRMERFFFFF